jgi:hypothetical protein
MPPEVKTLPAFLCSMLADGSLAPQMRWRARLAPNCYSEFSIPKPDRRILNLKEILLKSITKSQVNILKSTPQTLIFIPLIFNPLL